MTTRNVHPSAQRATLVDERPALRERGECSCHHCRATRRIDGGPANEDDDDADGADPATRLTPRPSPG